MNQQNKDIVKQAIANYKDAAFTDIFARAEKVCERILRDAIFWRRHMPGAHNFTGNFINSIRVVLLINPALQKYVRGRYSSKNKFVFEPGDLGSVPHEMMNMMSADRGGSYVKFKIKKHSYSVRQESVNTERGLYRFNRDYSWDRNTHYVAGEFTPNTTASVEANKLVSKLRLEDKSNIFEIHVVYGAPYAQYIEEQRGTTGIESTKSAASAVMTANFLT